MNNTLKIAIAALLFGLLILIRAFQGELFYDPLIEFFKVDHSTEALPNMNLPKLMGNLALRFLLNTLISLWILWVLFRKKEILKISGLLYLLLFLVLSIAFAVLVNSSEEGGHLALFYVRRFLIQPLFLLLLIPAFYFQRKT
jgi:exosortase F-associated protein